jgi:Glycosyl hydrolases family 43
MQRPNFVAITSLAACAIFLTACSKKEEAPPPPAAEPAPVVEAPKTIDPAKFLTQPLVTEIYTADPSAHVFNGKIWIYGSHDIDAGVPQDDLGSHFAMRDYQPISMDSITGVATVHPVALDIKDVPWAGRQMWAPDAAEKNGKYYLYFPVKDKQDVFKIGVAVGDNPAGPFKAQPEAIKNSFSMDPAVFKDSDGKHYMYFGGLWGGQLQRWKSGEYKADDEAQPPDNEPALLPYVARMADDMLEFAEKPKAVKIVDENGKLLLSGDHDRRFFEASWVHKYKGNYYFSYSTGDTHFIAYAMGKSPYGPFTYKGKILEPVLGWTNHHSITEVDGKWYLFYHDAQVSNGDTHLRNIKRPIEITYNEDGTIQTIDPFQEDPPAATAEPAPPAA